VLPGGKAESTDAVSDRTLGRLRMRSVAEAIAGRLPEAAVGTVRYRHRGWNAPGRDPVQDTLAVLADLDPSGPVVLVGHSMGGRVAVHAADHPAVTGIVALAPWLLPEDPVTTVRGRTVVIAHGSLDRWVPAAGSAAWATRAVGIADRFARFVVPGDVHMMWRFRARWNRFAARSAAAVLGGPVPDWLARGFAAGRHGEVAVPLAPLARRA
jgi:dienelactone hydrolase